MYLFQVVCVMGLLALPLAVFAGRWLHELRLPTSIVWIAVASTLALPLTGIELSNLDPMVLTALLTSVMVSALMVLGCMRVWLACSFLGGLVASTTIVGLTVGFSYHVVLLLSVGTIMAVAAAELVDAWRRSDLCLVQVRQTPTQATR